MAARQARGLRDAKKSGSTTRPARANWSLADGTAYTPELRVRHVATGELGRIAWVTWLEAREMWQAVVSWDAQAEVRPAPRCKQPLYALVAA